MRQAAVLLLALLAAGCSDSSVVHVKDLRFQPDELAVAAGTVVHFLNDGPSAHTVTVHDPAFATVEDAEVAKGASHDVRFAAKGDYHVFCRIHPEMALTVHVT